MSRKYQSMSDQIRCALAERIGNGLLPPGTRLIELEIAREFETSQTPVREAFRVLETMRLVETEPYRGTRVRQASPREMAESYCVRGALEQLASELAAPKLRGNVGSLRSSIEGIRTSALAGDHEGYTRHNLDFHRAIVAAADNSVLLRAWEALEFETRMRVNVARASHNDLIGRVQIHIDIADALEAGDGIAAGKMLREHSLGFGATWDTEAAPVSDAPSAPKRHSQKRKDD